MIAERRCINLYSDMNPWMDLVILVNDEDFDKAKEVAEKVVDCLSDGYDDEENRDEIENLLYDSLSQISNDNPIKIVLVRLCETIEELQS